MFVASLYIIVCSARNRIRVRLRRLREPRYLFGAAVGIAYLYLTVFSRLWGGRPPALAGRRRTARPANVALEAFRDSGPNLVGIALLIAMALGWFFPGDSGLLEFTPAETQFLFPAPVTRRALLVHRLMRSQLGLFFAAIIPAIVFPSTSAVSRVKFGVAMWIVLVTMKVHFTGITLTRANLTLRGAGVRRRPWTAIAVVIAAVLIVGAAAAGAFTGFPETDIREVLDRLGRVGTTGASQWILWPFAALARPLFAPWPGPFLAALGGALLVLAVNVVWVLRSDEAFQEAAAEAEARRAARKERTRPVVRVRAAAWTLPVAGGTETLFAWKNAVQLLRSTTGAGALRYAAPLAGISIGLTSGLMAATHAAGAAAVCGMFALAVAGFAVILGPQIVRTDLREDLLHLELLKTWPTAGSAVVRGEMLAPAALLTLIAWIATLCALLLSAAAFTTASLALRVSIATTIAIVAPAIIAAQLTVHNAAVIFFPGWLALGTQRARGLDAMGQRLILFFGIALALALMLVPGLVPAGLVVLVFYRLFGPAVLVPASVVLTALVLVEVAIATEILGPAYERIDLTAIERAE